MITNDGRRVVAAKLRECISRKPTSEDVQIEMLYAALGLPIYHKIDCEFIELLADLIEPEESSCCDSEGVEGTNGERYDERREVAKKLHELDAADFDGNEYYDCGEVEDALGLVTDDSSRYSADGVRRLAELLEPKPKPKPERTCRNLIIGINKRTPLEYQTDNFLCSACRESYYADSEYINHPIDWAYCPNCGARVTD